MRARHQPIRFTRITKHHSRSLSRCLATTLLVLASTLAAAPASAERITLDEALKRAEQHSPELQAAEADVEVSEGVLLGARTLPYNPALDVRLGPAFGGGQTFFEYEVGLSQTLELGGQRGKRIAGAEARRGASEARLRFTRYFTALRVRRAFFLALVAHSRLETAREAEAVAAELKAAAVDRIGLGAGTQLEVNVGTAAVGRAKAERMAAERRYREALVEFASVLGAPAEAVFEPEGSIPNFGALAITEDAFVARVLGRDDLLALKLERDAAQADLALAEALAVPDITLGVIYGRDAVDNADAVLFGLSIPIPLFNRNQGGQAAAKGTLRRTTILADAGRKQAEREARALFRNYALAREAVLGFDRDVVEKLGENLALARESFRAGKIGLLEFNVVRRDLVDTRVAYLESLAQLVDAWFALEVASGGTVGVLS